MAWFILLVAGLLEIVWATAFKHSGGFSRLGPTVLGLSASAMSFFLLAIALKTLPIGTAYAVWVGIGVLGTAAVGIVALGEPATLTRLACFGLILAGILGLRLLDG